MQQQVINDIFVLLEICVQSFIIHIYIYIYNLILIFFFRTNVGSKSKESMGKKCSCEVRLKNVPECSNMCLNWITAHSARRKSSTPDLCKSLISVTVEKQQWHFCLFVEIVELIQNNAKKVHCTHTKKQPVSALLENSIFHPHYGVARCSLKLRRVTRGAVDSAQHEAPLNNCNFTSASGYRSKDERLSQDKHRILSCLSYLIFNETHTHVIDSRSGKY